MGSKSRVKGIVVQIGGDTVGLDKALQNTNKQIGNTQSKLKDVERLLKLDPTNTVLLEQKQKLLFQATKETAEKLRTLNETNDDLKDKTKNYDAWKQAYEPIKAQIDDTAEKLKKLKAEQQEMKDCGDVDTDAYKQLTEQIQATSQELRDLKKDAKAVDDEFGRPVSPDAYDALQREIIETEQQLKSLEARAKDTLNTVDAEAEDAARKMKELGDAAAGVKDKAAKVADTFAPATKAVIGVAGAAMATVPATEDLREGLSRLDQNALENGVAAQTAREAWKEFTVQSGDTDSAIEATANLLQAGFTESNLQKAVEGLAGAANRFPDTLKVESLADSLQETLATGAATGQFAELMERLGLSVEDFDTAMAACTTDAERQDLALQTLASAGLNDSWEAWKRNNEEMVRSKEAGVNSQLAMAELAETVLPFVTAATEQLTAFLKGFNALPGPIKLVVAAMALMVGAISPVASAVSGMAGLLEMLSKANLPGLSGALETISGTALPGLGTAFKTVATFIASNPIVLILAAVAGLVAGIRQYGGEMIEFLNVIDSFLQDSFAYDWTEVFGPVLGGALNLFFDEVEAVWTAVKGILEGVINFIQGVFTGNWEQAWLGVRQIFKGIFDGLEKLLKAPINAVIGLVNKAISGINWLIDGVNKIPGVELQTIGQIPMLANGGEVIRGNAIVGEGGPELLTVLQDRTVVQPLTNNYHSITRNLGGVNVAVYGAPGQDIQELAEAVAEEMQNILDREEAAV